MLNKTKGIVLGSVNYNDKYNLVQMFTSSFGKVTYLVAKTKGKSGKVPKSLFMPMSVIEMEVSHQPSRDIQRIKEAHSLGARYSIFSDMAKSSVVFFVSEFLNKALRDINDSAFIFSFIEQSVNILEMTERSVANYHLVLMLKLSHFLGFYPNLEDYSPGNYFDMINGEFVNRQPLHRHYLDRMESQALARLSRITYENMHYFNFSRNERVNIVSRMLEYYRLHLYDFPEMKSLDVLHELFN